MASVLGGVEHQRADRVVAAQVAPDLLTDQLRGLRAQYRAGAALVGLELIEGCLDLPALGVGTGQFQRGGLAVIQDRGDQPIRPGRLAAVIDGIPNDPDLAWVLALTVRGGVEDLGQPGPVWQVLYRVQFEVALDAPEQVSACAAGTLPGGEAVKTAIG